MEGRVMKLSHYIAANIAAVLVGAGFDTPAKIKAASDEELLAVLKRQSALEDVRAVFPALE